MRYFLGLGSNIAPHTHIPLMLSVLLQLTPRLEVGRVLETAPVAVAGDPFLNVPVAFTSELAPGDLKRFCNAIEVAFGRDRDDPGSKVKSRSADLDLLFWVDEATTFVAPELLPHEPYMRPMLLELLGSLGLETVAETPTLPAGVAVELRELRIGRAPATITKTDGRYVAAPVEALTPQPPLPERERVRRLRLDAKFPVPQ